MGPKVIFYIILAVCAGFGATVTLVHKIKYFFRDLDFYVLLLATFYFIYMTILEMAISGEETSGEGLLSSSRTAQLRDQVAKYLFSFTIGCILISGIVNRIFHGHFFGSGVIDTISTIFIVFVLPIGCIIDLFITPRNRCPKVIVDFIIFVLIAVLFFVLERLVHRVKWGQCITVFILRILFTCLGYYIYDLILYKKEGGTGWCSLFEIKPEAQ